MSSPTGSIPGRFGRRGLLAGGVAGLAGLAGCTGEDTPVPPSVPPTSAGSGGSSPASASASPRGTVVFWTGLSGDNAEALSTLLERFNEESTTVTVEHRHQDWSDFYPALSSAVVAGEGPDLALVQGAWVPTLAARKQVQPMDTLNQALGYQSSGFAGPAWLSGGYQQRQYGLPYDLSPLGLFFNRTLLTKAGLDPAKPPTDSTAYQAALTALKAAGVEAQSASAEGTTGGLSCLALLRQFGGQFLTDENRSVGWTNEAGLKALTWYGDLRTEGYAPAPVSDSEDRQRFRRGDVAFRWGLGEEIGEYAGTSGLAWGLAPLPNIGGTAGTWCGSRHFVLPGTAAVPAERSKACGELVQWLFAHSVDWARSGHVPALNSARESRDFRSLTDQSTLASQLDRAVVLPAVPGVVDLADEWFGCVREVVRGDNDPRTALNAATDRARRTLELNRQRYG